MGNFATKSNDDGIPYTQAFINTGGSDGKQTIYIGEAEPGTAKSTAKWRIRYLTLDANDNVTDIQWANGTRNFDKIFNNYASYSYS